MIQCTEKEKNWARREIASRLNRRTYPDTALALKAAFEKGLTDFETAGHYIYPVRGRLPDFLRGEAVLPYPKYLNLRRYLQSIADAHP